MDDYGLGVLSGLFIDVSVRVLLLLTALSPDCGLVVGCGVSQAATINKPITPNVKRIFFINESLVLPMVNHAQLLCHLVSQKWGTVLNSFTISTLAISILIFL